MASPCNLLITHDAPHREAARRNADAVLEALESGARFAPAAPEGVFEVVASRDRRRLLEEARGLCGRDPRRFAHTHHWRPVDAWVPSNLPDMVQAVRELAPRISSRDVWKLSADIHGASPLRLHDLVRPLTDPVQGGRVQMHDPDKELRVDVLGPWAALAVLARGEDLRVDLVRRATMAVAQDV
ncbi:MAG TPA: hypothetical protein VGR28_13690 [Candidatus Thermoplasmatota archaeon]|jgi:hypothetical protein|nr:hypothetical protein [Candidatus Thermoplasmatota archaeon]